MSDALTPALLPAAFADPITRVTCHFPRDSGRHGLV